MHIRVCKNTLNLKDVTWKLKCVQKYEHATKVTQNVLMPNCVF